MFLLMLFIISVFVDIEIKTLCIVCSLKTNEVKMSLFLASNAPFSKLIKI